MSVIEQQPGLLKSDSDEKKSKTEKNGIELSLLQR